MTPELLIPGLFLLGVVLIVGEILLPTHGVVGLLGFGAIVAAIVIAFRQNQWLGAGLMIGTLVASPFVVAGALKVYPKTYFGKRMLLPNTESRIAVVPLRPGDTGRTLSELRPAGACQFSAGEFEVFSEGPMIKPNTAVQVVNVEAGRITVRAIG